MIGPCPTALDDHDRTLRRHPNEQLLRRSVEVAQDELVRINPVRGEAELILGQYLLDEGASEEANVHLAAAYECLSRFHGDNHPNTVAAREALERASRL